MFFEIGTASMLCSSYFYSLFIVKVCIHGFRHVCGAIRVAILAQAWVFLGGGRGGTCAAVWVGLPSQIVALLWAGKLLALESVPLDRF